MAPLSARVKSPSVTTGDMPTKWASFNSFGARCSASLWYKLTSYGTWSSSWVEDVEELQMRERNSVKTDQEPEYPLRARVVKMVDGQNHRGGNGGPSKPRQYLIVADDPHSGAYDQLITVFPSDHEPMLIVFCFLYLTYSPWPVAGAIWARSTKGNPDTDKLREFPESGYECKSKVIAVVSHVLGDRRVSFRDSSGKQRKPTSRTSSRTTVSDGFAVRALAIRRM